MFRRAPLMFSSTVLALGACASADGTLPDPAGQAITSGRDTLNVAVSSPPSSIDPHFAWVDSNLNVDRMFYDSLYEFTPKKDIVPSLATKGAITSNDQKTWSFELRSNVKFHHGQGFTRADVLCTFHHVQDYKHAHGTGYKGLIGAIDLPATDAANAAGDPLSLQIVTTKPYLFLPGSLAELLIMSCDDTKRVEALENADPGLASDVVIKNIHAAFADPSERSLTNGTGPYRLARWAETADGAVAPYLEGTRYDGYVGINAPAWAGIRTSVVTSEEERMNGLVAGTYDFIQDAPPARLGELDGRFAKFQTRSLRTMYIQMYASKVEGVEASSFYNPVIDEAGAKKTSPFFSAAFRRACALATDKASLVATGALAGSALITGQMLPEGRIGHIQGYPDTVFDLAAARRSFVDAVASASAAVDLSYFKNHEIRMELRGTNDRYPHDVEILTTVAAQWTAAFGGFDLDGSHYSLTVTAVSEPQATYFGHDFEYVGGLIGGGNDNGQAEGALRLYFLPTSGLNDGHYVNDAVRQQYDEGVATTDAASSATLLTSALEMALDDTAIIPLFNPIVFWAGKSTLAFEPRIDDSTFPDRIRKR